MPFLFHLKYGNRMLPAKPYSYNTGLPSFKFYCCLPYPRKRRMAMPPVFSALITYMDTRPSDSIHILPHLRAHTCPHPHNRWSCPNTPQWRPAYSSHIHPAVLTPPGHTRLPRWLACFEVANILFKCHFSFFYRKRLIGSFHC